MTQESHLARRTAATLAVLCGVAVGMVYLSPSLFGSRALLPADLWARYPPWGYELAEKASEFPSNQVLYDIAWNVAPNVWTVRRAYAQGDWPLWDPYARCGSPLLANGQCAPFAVTNIPHWLLPWPSGFAYAALLRWSLLWIGSWLLGRRLGLGAVWSAVLALGIGLCPGILSWFQHPNANVLVFMPWLLWSVEYLAQEHGRRRHVMAALPLSVIQGLHLLGGHVHSSFCISFGTVCYLLVRLRWHPARAALRIRVWALGAMAFGAVLAAIALLPAAEFLLGSYTLQGRQSIMNGRWYLPPDVFRLLLNPMCFGTHISGAAAPWTGPTNWCLDQQYVGGAVWVLLAVGLPCLAIRWMRRDLPEGDGVARAAGLILFGAIPGCLAYGWQPLHWWLTALPPFSYNTNAYFAALFQVCLCASGCLLAAGVPTVAKVPATIRTLVVLFGLLAAVVSSGALVSMAWRGAWELRILVAVAGTTFACVGLLLRGHRWHSSALALSIGLLWACDVMPAWKGYHVQAPAEWARPDRIRGPLIETLASVPSPRIVAEDAISPRSLTYFGISDSRSYEWPESMRNGLFRVRLLGLKNDNLSVEDLRDKARLVSLNETGAQWLVTSNLMRGKILEPAWHRGAHTVYRILCAPPIAAVYRSDAVTWVSGPDESLLMMKALQEAQHESVVIEDQSLVTTSSLKASGPGLVAEFEREGMNGIRIKGLGADGGVLVVRESYDPGWKAWVDGRRVPVLPAQLKFMAVQLPSGCGEVRLRYSPWSFRAGAVLSLLGFLCVAVVAVCGFRRRVPGRLPEGDGETQTRGLSDTG